MTQTNFLRKARGLTAAVVGTVFLFTTVATPLVEANFWDQRRDASRRVNGKTPGTPTLLAQLPGSMGSMDGVLPAVNGALGAGLQSAPSADLSGTPTASDLRASALPSWLRGLPNSAGEIRDVALAKNAETSPIVVLVQDVHNVFSAQKNIAQIVSHIESSAARDHRGPVLVGLEGGVGAFDIARFRALKNRLGYALATELLLKTNLIAGPEFYAFQSEKEPLLWGVETREDYIENAEAVRAGHPVAERVAASVASAEMAVEKRGEVVFSPELKDLNRILAAYNRGDSSIVDLVRVLKAYAPKSSVAEVDKLQKALDMEKGLDFAQVERERKALIEVLVRVLDASSIEKLTAASLSYRSGQMNFGTYHAQLKSLVKSHGIRWSEYGAFDKYVQYVLLSESIDKFRLFDQIEDLKARAVANLGRSQEEKNLMGLGEDLRLVHRLVRHEFGPAEWKSYQERKTDLARLNARLAEALGADGVAGVSAQDLAPFERFYVAADRRNDSLAANLVAKGKELDAQVMVLVAGGFHTAELENRIKAKGYSVVTLTPAIGEIPTDLNYLDIFTVKNIPLEQFLKGEKLYFSPPRPLAGGGLSEGSPATADAAREIFSGAVAATGVVGGEENPGTAIQGVTTRVEYSHGVAMATAETGPATQSATQEVVQSWPTDQTPQKGSATGVPVSGRVNGKSVTVALLTGASANTSDSMQGGRFLSVLKKAGVQVGRAVGFVFRLPIRTLGAISKFANSREFREAWSVAVNEFGLMFNPLLVAKSHQNQWSGKTSRGMTGWGIFMGLTVVTAWATAGVVLSPFHLGGFSLMAWQVATAVILTFPLSVPMHVLYLVFPTAKRFGKLTADEQGGKDYKPENIYENLYNYFGQMGRTTGVSERDIARSRRFITSVGNLQPREKRRQYNTFGISEVWMLGRETGSEALNTVDEIVGLQEAIEAAMPGQFSFVERGSLHLTTRGMGDEGIHSGFDTISLSSQQMKKLIKAQSTKRAEAFRIKFGKLNWDPSLGIILEVQPFGGQNSGLEKRRRAWGTVQNIPPHVTLAYFTKPFSEKEIHHLNEILGELNAARRSSFDAMTATRLSLVAYENLAFARDEKYPGYILLNEVPLQLEKNRAERNASILGLDLGKSAEVESKNSQQLFGLTVVVGHPLPALAQETLETWQREISALTSGKVEFSPNQVHATIGALLRSQDNPAEAEKLNPQTIFAAVQQMVETPSLFPFTVKLERVSIKPDGNVVLEGTVRAGIGGLDPIGKLRKAMAQAGAPLKYDSQGETKVWLTLAHLGPAALAAMSEEEAHNLNQWVTAHNNVDQVIEIHKNDIRLVSYTQRNLLGTTGPDLSIHRPGSTPQTGIGLEQFNHEQVLWKGKLAPPEPWEKESDSLIERDFVPAGGITLGVIQKLLTQATHWARFERYRRQTWRGVLTDVNLSVATENNQVSQETWDLIGRLLKAEVPVGLVSAMALETTPEQEAQGALNLWSLIQGLREHVDGFDDEMLRNLWLFPENGAYGVRASAPNQPVYISGKRFLQDPNQRIKFQETVDQVFDVSPILEKPLVVFKKFGVTLRFPKNKVNDEVMEAVKQVAQRFLDAAGMAYSMTKTAESIELQGEATGREDAVDFFRSICHGDDFISLDDQGGKLGAGIPLVDRVGGVSVDVFDPNNKQGVSSRELLGESGPEAWTHVVAALENRFLAPEEIPEFVPKDALDFEESLPLGSLSNGERDSMIQKTFEYLSLSFEEPLRRSGLKNSRWFQRGGGFQLRLTNSLGQFYGWITILPGKDNRLVIRVKAANRKSLGELVSVLPGAFLDAGYGWNEAFTQFHEKVQELAQKSWPNWLSKFTSPEDKKAVESEADRLNVELGGVPRLLEGRSPKDAFARPVPYSNQVTREEKADYLRLVKAGMLLEIMAGGRATRLQLPPAFDKLGLGGLTHRLLQALPNKGGVNPAVYRADIERAVIGDQAGADDLSILQGAVLQWRWQLEQMVKEVNDSSLTLEAVLAGAHVGVVANGSNWHALSNQLKAIDFGGFSPSNTYVHLQEEKGFWRWGQAGWEYYAGYLYPEGHLVPFLDFRKPTSALTFDKAGRPIPLGRSFVDHMKARDVQRSMFFQVNDMHILSRIASVGQWSVVAPMFDRGVQFVAELVSNDIKQKGGAMFAYRKRAAMRDTIASKGDPALEEAQYPGSLSRMTYFVDPTSLSDIPLERLPFYANLRTTPNGVWGVGTEGYSGDLTSELVADSIQNDRTELKTFKMRARLDVATQAMNEQIQQAGFLKMLDGLREQAVERQKRVAEGAPLLWGRNVMLGFVVALLVLPLVVLMGVDPTQFAMGVGVGGVLSVPLHEGFHAFAIRLTTGQWGKIDWRKLDTTRRDGKPLTLFHVAAGPLSGLVLAPLVLLLFGFSPLTWGMVVISTAINILALVKGDGELLFQKTLFERTGRAPIREDLIPGVERQLEDLKATTKDMDRLYSTPTDNRIVYDGNFVPTENPLALRGVSAYPKGAWVLGDDPMAGYNGIGNVRLVNVQGQSFDSKSVEETLSETIPPHSSDMSEKALAIADFSDTIARMPFGQPTPEFFRLAKKYGLDQAQVNKAIAGEIPSFELVLGMIVAEDEKNPEAQQSLFRGVAKAFGQLAGMNLNDKTNTWLAPLQGKLQPEHFQKLMEVLNLELNPNFLKAAKLMRDVAQKNGSLSAADPFVFDIATGIVAEVIEAFFKNPAVAQVLAENKLELGAVHTARVWPIKANSEELNVGEIMAGLTEAERVELNTRGLSKENLIAAVESHRAGLVQSSPVMAEAAKRLANAVGEKVPAAARAVFADHSIRAALLSALAVGKESAGSAFNQAATQVLETFQAFAEGIFGKQKSAGIQTALANLATWAKGKQGDIRVIDEITLGVPQMLVMDENADRDMIQNMLKRLERYMSPAGKEAFNTPGTELYLIVAVGLEEGPNKDLINGLLALKDTMGELPIQIVRPGEVAGLVTETPDGLVVHLNILIGQLKNIKNLTSYRIQCIAPPASTVVFNSEGLPENVIVERIKWLLEGIGLRVEDSETEIRSLIAALKAA